MIFWKCCFCSFSFI